jgi:OmpA-OmpF porin, OOP family
LPHICYVNEKETKSLNQPLEIMITSTRIKETTIKIIILVLIVLGAAFHSVTIQAQSFTATTSHNRELTKSSASAQGVPAEAKAIEFKGMVNSAFPDIKPKLAPSGKRLYFSRNFHPGNTNGVNDPEDIWYSDFDAVSNSWTEPVQMRGPLNNAGPNFINNISATGDTIILGNQYLKKGKMRAGLSYTVRSNGGWSPPTSIQIVGDYNMSAHDNAFVSLSTGIILRSVQRAESIGDRDLFVSFWDGKEATEPVNMGAVINTEFEESSPYLAADNKTLYFASKGHKGLGGFDIYVTTRLDDSWTNWSTPQNLGPAVNGALDDQFFSITHCGKFAMFAKQVSVHNTDLYTVSMDVVLSSVQPEKKSMTKEASSVATR